MWPRRTAVSYRCTAVPLLRELRYIDTPDIFGWTALHYAVHHGQMDASVALLGHDANLIIRSRTTHYNRPDLPPGVTALHLAAARGSLTLVKLLLRAYVSAAEPEARGSLTVARGQGSGARGFLTLARDRGSEARGSLT